MKKELKADHNKTGRNGNKEGSGNQGIKESGYQMTSVFCG